MACQKCSVDDKNWPEVDTINSYAVFMGYLLMGVRGLGFLVLTWTTVVLLGGFVSMLQMKDFWCLTIITLVQTAGVFDFLLKEKASDIVNSLKGLLFAIGAAVLRPLKKDYQTYVSSKLKGAKEPSIARFVLASALLLVQLLLLAIVLCPIAVLYLLGMYISTGFSLWRLIQHDYGNTNGGVNLRPALNILYSLAVAQGVVYSYRAIYDLVARTGLVEEVARWYSLETSLVLDYLEETVAGCRNDPSSARGRNLITYGVDLLMESKSRYGYFCGVLILGKVHQLNYFHSEQQGLLKQLLTGSPSFSHAVERLLETFGPTSPYSTEIRIRAARIVATVASSIRLGQFPAQGMRIECISFLLNTFEEYSWRPEGYDGQHSYLPKEYEQDWLLNEEDLRYLNIDNIPSAGAADSKKQESDSGNPLQGYKGLVVQGLCILQKLATNEDNCRVIENTQGLLCKAIAPLISDQLHNDHHFEWSSIAEESIELMKRLMANSGETETRLPSEILVNSQSIIRTLQGILECRKCEVLLKRQGVVALLDLSVDTPSIMSGFGESSRTVFIWILLHIFLLPDYHLGRMCGSTHLVKKCSYTRRLAGAELQAILRMQLGSVGDVIASLAISVAAETNADRRHAATILAHLCRYYTKDDEYLKELKEAMTNVMPEVLKQILCWRRTTEGNNGEKAIHAAVTDIEQGGGVADEGEQHVRMRMQEALLHLCWAINSTWIDKDQDLTRRFNEIAANICSEHQMPRKTFRTLVREAQEKHWDDKRASGLAAVPKCSSCLTRLSEQFLKWNPKRQMLDGLCSKTFRRGHTDD